MMYCSNCGEKIIENNTFCTNCGYKCNSVLKREDSGKKLSSIVLGCIGIFLALQIIFAPISLILTIIGLIIGIIVSKRESNTLGIVVNVIGLILSILGVCLILFIFLVIMGVRSDMDHYYHEEIHEVYDQDRVYY